MKKIKKFVPWVLGAIVVISVLVLVFILNNHQNDASSGSTTDEIVRNLEIDNGDQKIDWSLYPTSDITLSGSYTIRNSGTYNLTGDIKNGLLTVDANDRVVKLVLNGVNISNDNGPAIYVESAKDVVIELAEGSNNYMSDGDTYYDFDEDVTGVIFSKDDLTFQGSGNLEINANYLDGIVGKDDLKFIDGKYKIISHDDGIRGTDSVYIVGGQFDLTSGGDGLKSTNETEALKGFIRIENGNFNIDAGGKGIKAINDISIDNGSFEIISADDAIHSNDYIGIKNGAYHIISDDDGLHADAEMVIDGGKIALEKSYEGLEAARVTINGGDISIISRDDGINVAGGNDDSSKNRPGANPFSVNEEGILTVNGGKVYVNSTGDGLDSNGYIFINGGEVVVDGPVSNTDGALDANGGVIVKGGTLVAVGASGMAEGISEKSSIYSISAYISSSAAGNLITLYDDNQNVLFSHTAPKSFQHIVIAIDALKPGNSYSLHVGNNVNDFIMQGVVTTIGARNGVDPMNHGRR